MLAPPEVDCEQQHPSLAVPDVMHAVDFYTRKLGFKQAFTWGDPPTMAGVNLDQVQLFLEQGPSSPQGCAVYFVVGNADQLYEFHRASGVDVIDSPDDRSWGLRDYTVAVPHWKSNGWMSLCGSRNAWPRRCAISPRSST